MRVFDTDHSCPKGHTAGTHRTCSPEETLARWLPRCPELGITRLANVTGLDHVGVPVYQSIRPNSKTVSVSQGKGLTAAAAKASAMMESIEGWHAESISTDTCFDSARRLSARAEIPDLTLLPRQSRRPIDPDEVRPWVLGFDLIRRQRCWVPYELADLNRTHRPRRPTPFPSTSSGLASGNHLLEAICHGFYELIEHDANAIWRHAPGDGSGFSSLVDLDTITDPGCREVLSRLRAAGLSVGVADITSDIGIPCYWCIVVDDPQAFQPQGFAWGQGCHLAPEVALLRALTEAAQVRVGVIAGTRDDVLYDHYEVMRDRQKAAGLKRAVDEAEPTVRFDARASRAAATFEDDLETLLAAVQAVGIDSAIVIDLTQPDLGVPVIKGVLPGAEALVFSDIHIPGPRLARLLEQETQR